MDWIIKISNANLKVCYYEPHFIVYRQQRTGVSAHVYDSGAFGLSDFRTGADLKGTGLETDYLDRHSLRGKCPGCDHYAVLLLFHRNFYGTDLGNFSVQSLPVFGNSFHGDRSFYPVFYLWGRLWLWLVFQQLLSLPVYFSGICGQLSWIWRCFCIS